ncbi:MAG: SRPBCC family protein [Thaumarchaeota archaeon]|nr:SRPBCC family protein [Nitrososphaerota archaeon]
MSKNSTHVIRRVNATRERIYRALVDPIAIAKWRAPNGMTMRVHSFEAREGGPFRISLEYDDPTSKGKTSARTDTYHGRFVKLVPNEQVVEVDEFESMDPALAGEMTITITLVGAGGSTDVIGIHEGLPPGVSTADNEQGWRMALGKLAKMVETKEKRTRSRT